MIARLFAGLGQANGDDDRAITRYGGDLRATWGNAALMTFLKWNDWGPYDFHRDFNLTYPVQWMMDLSYGTRMDILRNFDTRMGTRFTLRYLDENSPEGLVLPEGDEPWANEYEWVTYYRIAL